jgi:hypothetical protein
VVAHVAGAPVRSGTGIEALVWLRDIAGQSRAEAAETVRRTARALLENALGDAPGGVAGVTAG